MIFIFFNLLVNSIMSLAIGLMLVCFSIWFFRIGTGRWKIFLLSLPFVKIIYDVVCGVPERSVLFSGIDPFSLPPKHQFLSVGAGLSGWRPYLSTALSVTGTDGKSYGASIGDYLLLWIYRTLGNDVPFIMVCTVLGVSLVLLARRAIYYYKFEKIRRRDRHSCASFGSLIVGSRVVDIYISSNFSGSPFTGGLSKPYICLPEDAVQKLNSDELNAVIAHEMGHVKYFDLVFTILIQVLGDLFWFVPGYRWLSRKIDRLREVAADGWAVSNSIDPYLLASVLLKLKEIPGGVDKLVLYSAFFREKSLLKERVDRLVGKSVEKRPRFGWQNRWVRYGAAILISVVVLNSVFGGNHKNEPMRPPKWLEGFNLWYKEKS